MVRRNALIVVMCVCLGSLAGCPDDKPDDEDACGEPTYAGAATDEAWRVVLDAYDRAEVGAADAVTITSPAPGEVFDKSADAPQFTWTSPLDDDSAQRATPRVPALSLMDLAFDIGIGEAHAHLPPISGDIYYVELAIPGRACPLTVLTTNLRYTLDADQWALVKAASGPITMTITSAYLSENRITSDGGPFRPAAATTFEVE